MVGALPEGGSKRHSRCGLFGVALNAPKADADLRSDAGEGDEAMIWELNPLKTNPHPLTQVNNRFVCYGSL